MQSELNYSQSRMLLKDCLKDRPKENLIWKIREIGGGIANTEFVPTDI